jgi:hypothetical protein
MLGYTKLKLKTNRSYDVRKQAHGLPYLSNNPHLKAQMIKSPKKRLKRTSLVTKVTNLPKLKQASEFDS